MVHLQALAGAMLNQPVKEQKPVQTGLPGTGTTAKLSRRTRAQRTLPPRYPPRRPPPVQRRPRQARPLRVQQQHLQPRRRLLRPHTRPPAAAAHAHPVAHYSPSGNLRASPGAMWIQNCAPMPKNQAEMLGITAGVPARQTRRLNLPHRLPHLVQLLIPHPSPHRARLQVRPQLPQPLQHQHPPPLQPHQRRQSR